MSGYSYLHPRRPIKICHETFHDEHSQAGGSRDFISRLSHSYTAKQSPSYLPHRARVKRCTDAGGETLKQGCAQFKISAIGVGWVRPDFDPVPSTPPIAAAPRSAQLNVFEVYRRQSFSSAFGEESKALVGGGSVSNLMSWASSTSTWRIAFGFSFQIVHFE